MVAWNSALNGYGAQAGPRFATMPSDTACGGPYCINATIGEMSAPGRCAEGAEGLTAMRLSILVSLVCALSASLSGQQKLVDRLRNTPESTELIISGNYPAIDLRGLVDAADVIGRTVVLAAESRLTPNESGIETVYTVQMVDTYFATRALRHQTIKVRRDGGVVNLDGRSVNSYETDFPPFEIGREYILFLGFDQTRGDYVVPYGSQGAFQNVDGLADQVSLSSTPIREERGKVPLASFETEIRQLATTRR